MDAKVLLSSGIITAYTWATAYEFWRGRAEPLVSRWPVIFMLFAHGALFLLRAPLSQVLPWTPGNMVLESVWLTVLSFEALLFTIAIAFILLAMAKERTEFRHKTAALIDPLTGIANRRAFLQDVSALGGRQQAPQSTTRRGAACGPRPLQVDQRSPRPCGRRQRAASVCRGGELGKLGPADLIGRMGGEEFAILLYDAGPRKGARDSRAHPAVVRGPPRPRLEGRPVRGTVSIGMVTAEAGFIDIPALLVRADEALYCAKERGRNRVEVAQPEPARGACAWRPHRAATRLKAPISRRHAGKPAANRRGAPRDLPLGKPFAARLTEGQPFKAPPACPADAPAASAAPAAGICYEAA